MEISGKPRIVIWFVSNDGRFIGNALIILERQFNGVNIIGVTASQKISIADEYGHDLPFIPLQELAQNGGGYDVVLVAGAKDFGIAEIVKFAKSIDLDADKILGDWIVCIPGFTLEKYRKLQRSQLSIFSMNCFGGIISNTLGLPFLSPFVNMFMGEDEYIRFLRNPRVYMEEKLVFERTEWQPILKFDYPIFKLRNILLYMNHYKDFDEAVKKWNERKQRINWYNLFVTAYTESQDFLKQFDELPYGKKICFVPFKSKLDSAWYIDWKIRSDLKSWWKVITDFAQGNPFYYDVFDMLLYGKKTPLIEM